MDERNQQNMRPTERTADQARTPASEVERQRTDVSGSQPSTRVVGQQTNQAAQRPAPAATSAPARSTAGDASKQAQQKDQTQPARPADRQPAAQHDTTKQRGFIDAVTGAGRV
jgi:hypothetical protein